MEIARLNIATLSNVARIEHNILYDLKHTAINQLGRLLSGSLVYALIPLFLTPTAQGYWFTMMSLAALAVFADLGFTNILLLFSAHEFSHLEFDHSNNITGSEEHLKRLANLLVFAIKWVGFLLIAIFPIVSLTGYYLLSQKPPDVLWIYPWLIYNTGTALTFFNSVLLSFIEGCNSVGAIQKMRFKIAMASSFLMILFLVLKLGLFALALSSVASSLFGSYLIVKNYGSTLKNLFSISKTYSYKWGKEFFPLIWRYAIGWTSGYFIFQIFTPIMFHNHGAVEAGKIGLSITLWSAVYSMASVWITTITPRINMYVAQKEYEKLNPLFTRHLSLSVITFLIGLVTVFAAMFILQGKIAVINRVISAVSMLFLAGSWLIQVVINGLAVYLRAHKKEPFAFPSVVSAVYITVATILCAKYLPPDYFFLGFFTSYLWGAPWALWIFSKRERLVANG